MLKVVIEFEQNLNTLLQCLAMPLPTAQAAVYLSYFSKTMNVWNTVAGMDSEEFNNSAGVDVEKSLWPRFGFSCYETSYRCN